MIRMKSIYAPAEPEHAATLAGFLASAESDHISGAAIVTDDGWLTT